MRRVRVALAQVNPTVGAIEANARLVVDWMERARRAGADIVAFPELTLTGYPPEDLLFKPAFIEANRRALADVVGHSRGLTAVLDQHGRDAVGRSRLVADQLRRTGVASLVIDCESGRMALGLAHRLSIHLGAQHVTVDEVEADQLVRAVRQGRAA